MLTPQEVSEHAFAKASFGGYNMAMVDEFLDVLTADYTTCISYSYLSISGAFMSMSRPGKVLRVASN